MNKENEEAIVVMQCAGWKKSCAGTFPSPDDDEKEVRFVANPNAAPEDGEVYVHPDGDAGGGQTWRQKLWHYNEQEKETNPYGLLKAGCLYGNPVYSQFFKKLGGDRFFLLSPAWGLVRSDFLIPYYNITFSKNPPKKKKSNKWGIDKKIINSIIKRDWPDNRFKNCSAIPKETNKTILFFGGKDYVEFFIGLTKDVKAKRVVFYYASGVPRKIDGVIFRHCGLDYPRNWYYRCAEKFLASNLE